MSPNETLKRNLQTLVDEKGFLTGLSVSYGNASHSDSVLYGLRREVLLTENGFGLAPLQLDENSIYDLASVTKVFTCIAVLQLMERGKFNLSDTLGSLDKRFSSLQNTPILDILSYEAVLKTPERVDKQESLSSAQKQVFACYRAKEEGEKLYSDMNALVLKYLVETLSGRSYWDYLNEQVFKPLGMKDTLSMVPPQRQKDLVDYNYEHYLLNGQYQMDRDVYPGLPHDPKARLLCDKGRDLPGHAGLFSTRQDMVRFAQGLLSGALLSPDILREIGRNRTGRIGPKGEYRQYMGLLCFAKSKVQRLSEVPSFMSDLSFGMGGYTGNHLVIDPEKGVFDLILGNRCHNRLTKAIPESTADGLEEDGSGVILWPDGRKVRSSCRWVYQKDALLHAPCYEALIQNGWLNETKNA